MGSRKNLNEKLNSGFGPVSYPFKFNSVQFLLLCWDKSSDKIERLNLIVYNFCYYVGIKALIKLNKTILY